jgi:hypothetical protein
VKLWLKHKLKNAPLKLVHDPDRWLVGLRRHFRYGSANRYEPEAGTVDPALAAGQWIVWPRFPVVMEGPNRPSFELDDRFHIDYFAPIDLGRLQKKAAEWELSAEQLGDVHLGYWDWEDFDHDEATGSRIRLWFPCNYGPSDRSSLPTDPPPASGLCWQRKLAAFVEPQLAEEVTPRQRLLLHGIFVPNADALQPAARIGVQQGASVWIDLRGAAALRLTADRKMAVMADETDVWSSCAEGLMARFISSLSEHVRQRPTSLTNVLAGWSGLITADHPALGVVLPKAPSRTTWDWWRAITRLPTMPVALPGSVFRQSVARDRNLDADLDLALYPRFGRAFDGAHNTGSVLAYTLDSALARDLARSHAHARTLGRALARILGHHLDLDVDLDRDRGEARDEQAYLREPALCDSLEASFLQEAFFPDLRQSWPWLELYPLRGMVGNAGLLGPTLLHFELEADGCTVHAADLDGRSPESIVQREYDLVFPTTVVPLGQLRRECPEWRESREPRRLGVLPFVVPSVCKFTAGDLKKLRAYFHVDLIYALLPSLDVWPVPFADWTADQWNHPDNVSALWDLKSGQVLWARGTGDLAWIRRTGRPPKQFFRWPDEEKGPLPDDR